ncbi:hypothetical protein SLEP1_g8390 [Rubroshorea leprosula]|uniref:BHLH domain-containing protein n=1 Tax=Rubroshorea leprosula TaxID=152421 RepID=A0AAV5I9F3_9ROSI|nr:hypothetical protein SLEP1_g8390 [Rubroshorea leprosula]
MEMEDPTFVPQHQMNPVDYSLDDCLNFQSFSTESYSSFSIVNPEISTQNMTGSGSCNIEASQMIQEDIEKPVKQLKTNNNKWEYSCASNKQIISKPSPSALSKIIYFENSDSSSAIPQQCYGDLNYAMTYKNEGVKRKICSLTRSPFHAQDHVIAERKRREKISELYMALSRLLPSLKKTDKTSILGDAIMHVKQLQERVKILEEKVAEKIVESAVLVKKAQIYADEESSSCQPNHSSLPEIEARVSDRDVLLRIHCEKNKGFLVNLLHQIEKLNLSVVSSNFLPFGRSTLEITIAAQMEDEFPMTAKDLVKNLRPVLQRLRFEPLLAHTEN